MKKSLLQFEQVFRTGYEDLYGQKSRLDVLWD